MIYKLVTASEAQEFLDWAEDNNVDWDIYNVEETLGENYTGKWEIGLDKWPDFSK